VLNGIFVFILACSLLLAAYTGQMQQLTDALFQSALTAVEIAIKLIGVMTFFLGLMKVAEAGGLLNLICRISAPVMRRLFPSVPAEHPAMSAMIMNIGCNMLGLGNAATPFGIRAIRELDAINDEKGTATNAMVTFLAINTAGFALLPTTAIGLRVAAGSADATGILIPTWLASGAATAVGVLAALGLARLPKFARSEPAARTGTSGAEGEPSVSSAARAITSRRLLLWLFWIVFALLLVRQLRVESAALAWHDVARNVMSYWILPAIVLALILFGWTRGVKVYEVFVDGAKEGFQVAVRIIPFLVAILVAIGMFRASGGMELFGRVVGPWTAMIGMPVEALPMAIVRPLSGSGAQGTMVEAMSVHGADSTIGYMVSTYLGSTETTFYVLAVYFGAAGVRRTRHALPACLLADAAGILTATIAVNLLFG
jgi:spore maturation protein SpmA